MDKSNKLSRKGKNMYSSHVSFSSKVISISSGQ
jgi:hypothetical protein